MAAPEVVSHGIRVAGEERLEALAIATPVP